MPRPSARLAHFWLLLSSETKVPAHAGGWRRSTRDGKAQLAGGADRRRGCGERPCAEERSGRRAGRGRAELRGRRGRGGRRPCGPYAGGRAHLAPAHLSGWAAGLGNEGKGRREARRRRRSRRSRLPDSGESPPGPPGPASAHVIPGPPLPPPLAREAASSAQLSPGAATWPAPPGGPGLLSREPPRGCGHPPRGVPILPRSGEVIW